MPSTRVVKMGPDNRIDLSGLVFGRLTALVLDHFDKSRPYWLCICGCGTHKIVNGYALREGRIVSCGCYNEEKKIKHNLSRTPEYKAWGAMIQRCFNEKSPEYNRYGGRGITVCERWKISAENFLLDMGKKPTSAHSLERKNNNGNYEPDNCCWATAAEQRKNQRPARRRH